MLDSLFQLLFEYRPVVFSQGELRFAAWTGSYVAALVALAAIVAAVATYRTSGARTRTRDRVILTTLRVALIALVALCLFRPVLVVKAAVPQQNVLAVLLDDSRSMQIADHENGPRSAYVRQEFGAADRGLLKALSDKFMVRTFRFSSAASRLDAEDDMTFAGAQTRLGAALEGARQELAGLPLAGLVVVSDGADTAADSLGSSLLALKSQGVPVFTVGVGQETLARDIQIGRVSTPRIALKGTTLMIDVIINQTGFAGQDITLDVEDEGRIVGSQAVKLPSDGSAATARVRFSVSDSGPRVFKFRVAPQPGELVAENNTREAMVDVRDRREKILYFEGEPRFEMKFIRRAVQEDPNLQLVVLQRTADNKYLRLAVDGPDDLVAGFPRTREELFAYRGLILGSIEAGAFTGDQLRMIAEFVDRRGGGLLMLGGARSFSEGGYAGTAVSEVLPVTLDASAREPQLARLTVRPTRAGAAQGVTQIAATESASAQKWTQLAALSPSVTTLNRTDGIKPGATVLLTGTDETRRERPVLAFQRYGRGKAFAFTLQDSLLWQMHASIAVEDLTHEYFWRQLMRWLVDGVPDAVEPQSLTDRVEPGEPITLRAHVVDSDFVELNDATVIAHVGRPDGSIADIPMQWSGERSGEYFATVPSAVAGSYEARIDAARGGKIVGSTVAHVRAAPGDAEFFDATMHAATLRRIADQTGGKFYAANATHGLAEDLRYTGHGVTTVEERDLWHLPIVFLLMVGLLCAEWAYRRKVGLS
ncbi:MAG TPA: glutamine amidotransferase [Vicinamibacterales bacterium]|nr:glutamine amidotransferase [Vicinamibacterales bacterium]